MVLSGRLGVLAGIGRVGLLGPGGLGSLPTLIHLYAVGPFRVVCFVLIPDNLCYPDPALVVHHRIVWRRDAVIRRPGVKSFLFVIAWLTYGDLERRNGVRFGIEHPQNVPADIQAVDFSVGIQRGIA